MIMALLRIRVEQVRSQDPNLTSLGEQLAYSGRPFYQISRATAGNQDIELDKPYEMGVGQLMVFLNGLKMQPTSTNLTTDGDYQEINSSTIRFVNPLQQDDVIEVRMEGKGQGVSMVVDHYHAYKEEPIGSVNGVNKVFILSRIPREQTELIFVNGMIMRPGTANDYTINQNIITFNDAPSVGAIILVNYDQMYIAT